MNPSQKWAEQVARAWILVFFVLTSLSLLLTFIPFTYEQIFRANVFPPLVTFTRIHPWLYLATAGITLWLFRREWNTNTPLAAALGVVAGSGLVFVVRPIFENAEGDISFSLSLVALAPLVALSALSGWRAAQAPVLDSARAFHAAWQSAVVAGLASGAIAWMQSPVHTPAAWAWSLLCHLTLALALFALIEWVRALASTVGQSGKVELLLVHGGIAAAIWGLFRAILSSTATFTGWKAEIYAALLGIAVACFLTQFRSTQADRRPVKPWLPIALTLAVVGVEVALLGRKDLLDWNFLFHKVGAGAAWITLFALLYRRPLVTFRVPLPWALGLVAVLSVGYHTLQAFPSSETLEAYAGYDSSFHLIRDMLAPPKAASDTEFYKYLAANTNVPRSVKVEPSSVDLVEGLKPTTSPKFPVFIFVVDSLRRDYLSPYNSKVQFTPAIEQFSHDSVKFENAFTHYGGTGLSEPSIWVGGLMFHKQYIQPFAPMNALEKLLTTDGYKELVSKDSILANILDPKRFESGSAVDVDENHANVAYDFCETAESLKARLTSPVSPLFVYAQPQNIHISVIQREGAKAIDSGDYGDFYSPYASRLARFDRCFGDFMGFLKAKGLYDNSLIVLTSDHGDSLGEEGRWGHAYTIYPEIVKIPLLVHLPQSERSRLAEGKLYADVKAPAFSTDITPSLYYLLGHGLSRPDPLNGRPLFTATSQEQAPYAQKDYWIAASYGAVYATLSGDGKSMLVSDASEYKDYALSMDSPRAHAPDPAAQSKSRERIRAGIDRIGGFYHFGPAQHSVP